MSADQVIQEIQGLTPAEQAKVIQFAYRLDAERMLSGKELGALAKRMIEASDPAEKLKIREELTRGFYGAKADAWNSPSRCPQSAPGTLMEASLYAAPQIDLRFR